MADPTPWYDRAFTRGYLDLYPHRDLPAARGEVAGLLENRPSGLAAAFTGRVLDLGCGFGRHLLALREHGIDAWGLDRSGDLLDRARELADGGLAGRLVRADFRALPFPAASFGTVVMLFSSFGYFDDAGNVRVLEELARVLVPGGAAVLDLMNPELVRATLVPSSERRVGALSLAETRRLTDGGRRVQKEVRITAEDGRTWGWHEDVRLYSVAELDPALGRVGLASVRGDGDFDGRPLAPEAPRQILWLRR
jgi:SAM-dependent methyltransferase